MKLGDDVVFVGGFGIFIFYRRFDDIFAGGDDGEVKDGAVHAEEIEGAVVHAGGGKDQGALGDDMPFAFQENFHLAAEVVGIIRVAAEESENFIAVVGMGGRPLGEGLEIPGAVHLK